MLGTLESVVLELVVVLDVGLLVSIVELLSELGTFEPSSSEPIEPSVSEFTSLESTVLSALSCELFSLEAVSFDEAVGVVVKPQEISPSKSAPNNIIDKTLFVIILTIILLFLSTTKAVPWFFWRYVPPDTEQHYMQMLHHFPLPCVYNPILFH